MEFSTEELKPLADRLAEMVSRELAHDAESAVVRDIETAMRRQLLEMGRLALGEVLSQADVDPEQNIACECPVADRLDAVAGRCSISAVGARRC